MYASYFGLSDKPFNATPDPRFSYINRGYQEAYATLLYGIRERKGFIALTGEVGTGKTTLLRRLMDNANPAARIVFLYNTALTFDELVEFICVELDLAVSGLDRVARLQALNTFLIEEAKRGGTVVLLLDEAQHLSVETLENLRLMSNLETSTAKLLQIVLVGQPELEAKLADPALRQVAQRITMRHRLERLRGDEVEPFIDYRLRVVGGQRRDLFTDEAIRKLIPYVNGIPRLINVVCDNALLLAYATDVKCVTGPIIDEVAADLRLRPSGSLPAKVLAAPSTSLRRGHQGARAPRQAASSAGGHRWAWVGVASGVVLALLGVAVAGRGGPVDIAWRLPTIGLLADWTSAWGRRQPAAPPPPAVRGSDQPVPVRARDAEPATEKLPSAAMAAVLRSASLPVEPSRGQPAAPETEAAEPVTGGGDLRGTKGAEIVGRWLTIPRGATVSEIVFDHYGQYSALALDLIQELNPDIRDIDRVRPGQLLWLPPLNLDALLRRQADGSYRLIVTSQPGVLAARGVVETVRAHGYAAAVTTREVASSQVLYRVEIDKLNTRAAAIRAWETFRRLESFDLKPEVPGSR